LGPLLRGVAEAPLPIDAPADHRTFREIVYTGNAGAGGAMLALAADHVYARSGVVLNPHYRSMGDLYGSEYWTYTLPRRVGQKRALELTLSCRPIGTRAAQEMGFLDDAFGEDTEAFEAELRERARRLALDPEFCSMLRKKHERRLDDEYVKPLASYRAEELEWMRANFFGARPRLSRGPPALRFQGSSAAAEEPNADSGSGRRGLRGSFAGSSLGNSGPVSGAAPSLGCKPKKMPSGRRRLF
jgi:Enoyl-CoA hydratase/isomerase